MIDELTQRNLSDARERFPVGSEWLDVEKGESLIFGSDPPRCCKRYRFVRIISHVAVNNPYFYPHGTVQVKFTATCWFPSGDKRDPYNEPSRLFHGSYTWGSPMSEQLTKRLK